MGRLKRKNRESHNRKEKNIILIGAEGDNRTESCRLPPKSVVVAKLTGQS